MSGAPVYREHPDIPTGSGFLPAAARALAALNMVIMAVAAAAVVAASVVLSYSVIVRYLYKAPTYWQDEAAVFLLVGATFMTAAFVQERRGHVGIEALAEILPPGVNRIRLLLVDAVSLAFCSFFAWKSWTLFHEAWVDGQATSSTWGPPLWIPYSLMAAGMTLLSVQIALQFAVAISGGKRK
jgi:TRAP-type C4-dicarboxylate transport system permease small subunit